MTPAVKVAERAGVRFQLHSYVHDPRAASYGLEAAELLGIDGNRVFKTLLVELDGDPRRLVVGVVPVTRQLNLKTLAREAGGKKAGMATPEQAQRTTGYLVGGISPLGQKRALPTWIDDSARDFPTVFVSAGRRGLEIELSPADLSRLTRGGFAPIATDAPGGA
jgi:Cys-tRNA(Pro)/Cys-tRNA(Cys) deacylase